MNAHARTQTGLRTRRRTGKGGGGDQDSEPTLPAYKRATSPSPLPPPRPRPTMRPATMCTREFGDVAPKGERGLHSRPASCCRSSSAPRDPRASGSDDSTLGVECPCDRAVRHWRRKRGYLCPCDRAVPRGARDVPSRVPCARDVPSRAHGTHQAQLRFELRGKEGSEEVCARCRAGLCPCSVPECGCVSVLVRGRGRGAGWRV
jgi:hypothetical protein